MELILLARYVNKKHDIVINYVFTSRVWHKEMDDWIRNYADENDGKKLDLLTPRTRWFMKLHFYFIKTFIEIQ